MTKVPKRFVLDDRRKRLPDLQPERPGVVEIHLDEGARPIHSFKRRFSEPANTKRKRPGQVYKLREWKVSPDL